ncbi:hypothetical protein C7Y72_06790 [Paraconexibacter algicola]|uniref:Glycosyltransferase n=1 Tax=Paraconexibacter algicola TaxID=2133960 RepID=A0A2T4UJG1_9ACTN|nr:hypothetical protein C7Y72_06790 [Paraconexibacter algicola]
MLQGRRQPRPDEPADERAREDGADVDERAGHARRSVAERRRVRGFGSVATPCDILLVALGSTGGLAAAEDELLGGLRRAGADVWVVRSSPPRDVRTLALTDLQWARAARRAAQAGLLGHPPRHAVVFSTVTGALLWPDVPAGVRRAIRYDAPAAANRPGRHGLWQRGAERRRLQEAELLLPQSPGTLEESPVTTVPAIVLPIPVEPSAPDLDGPRDRAAVTYATNWRKKGLDRVLAAWAYARRDGETLAVVGASPAQVLDAAREGGMTGVPAGVEVHPTLAPAEYRALLRRARAYVTAPRREDYGLAQLEALADGCALVSTDAPGPYVAVELARRVDARWIVADDRTPHVLAAAVRAALDGRPADLVARTHAVLAPYRRAATDRVIAEQVLPALTAR